MKIISASRRTDIPAFYGNWFMNRIRAGFSGYINPFNNKKYIISLKNDDVASIVLWSKNFVPFIENSTILKKHGYHMFFNYTITGLPEIFEPEAPPTKDAIESLKFLSNIFSPMNINWRYDPIILSDITDKNYHLDNFYKLCKSFTGSVKRCFISYPTAYSKVNKRFKAFTSKTGIAFTHADIEEKLDLAVKLSRIAANFGITVYSCCSNYLSGDIIQKGHCIDRVLISSLIGVRASNFKIQPTRKECGCAESTDLGVYNTCPHGCIYCYANEGSDPCASFYKKYISDTQYSESAFLGTSKDISDLWLKEIRAVSTQKLITDKDQLKLF